MSIQKPLTKGDIILVSNDPKPHHNREQKGLRPWLVLSEQALNEVSPFVWAVPFTTTDRSYPLVYEWLAAERGTQTYGTLLCDQLTTLDVVHRYYSFLEHTDVPVEVDQLVKAILGFE